MIAVKALSQIFILNIGSAKRLKSLKKINMKWLLKKALYGVYLLIRR